MYEQLRRWAGASDEFSPRVIAKIPAEAVVAICNPLYRDLERRQFSVMARLPVATAAGVINHPNAARTNKSIINFLRCRCASEFPAFFQPKSALWTYARRFSAKFYAGACELCERRQLAILDVLPPHLEEWRMLCHRPYLSVIKRMNERGTLDLKAHGAQILQHSYQDNLVPTIDFLLESCPELPFTSSLIHFAFDRRRIELWNRLRADPRFVPTH